MQGASEFLHIAQYLYTLLATCCGDSSDSTATRFGLEDAEIWPWCPQNLL
jgi:hypothetical protein